MSELLNYLLENEADFRRARLPALYADFNTLRTLNPDGFIANLSAWKRGLASAALAGHIPSRSSPNRNHFTLELDDSLFRSLESKQYGLPLALGTVMQDALTNGEIMPLQQFLKSKDSVYSKGWGGVPWSVLWWGLRQVGLVGAPGADGRMPKGVFVVLGNLEEGAKIFSDKTRSRTSRFERTFSKAHFRRTFEATLMGDQTLSEADFEVLVKFLSRDKGILATNGFIVKIRSSETEDAMITEEDSAIASLKELVEDLTKQTEVLSKRIEELNINAQDAVRKKNRVSALAALKSKKLAETNLSTRYVTLGQLEEVAAKIEQASDNVQLVKVMQSSTVALRNMNAEIGGADRVDEVLDSLREQMGEVDEVGNIIAEVGPGATVDEAEVDEEFEAMLAEERKKEEAIEKAQREEQQEKEADETRKRLAELEKLGPVGGKEGEGKDGKIKDANKQKEQGAATSVSTAAGKLDGMSIEEPLRVPAE
ncbi:Snf7-domain-containing protein [Pseudomassariella vexata]|uniref:Snf7-domain-containing protein n=1 Tax=Pseudomassariella vexata TaxID=1141098 RepID=A0A1Y2DK94_9PEZI|nr:Snf7-domain-containing protein [Pseudomassariella vexata]ORY59631.1 Snf7-domain-containing protein [Pseudomassariella vexata]